MSFGDVVNLLVLLAVVAGHLMIVRDLVGRAYRVGMPWGLWLTVGGVLVAAGVAAPWTLVVRVGRHGPRVLRGGSWWDASAGWQLYAGACLAVLLITLLERLRLRQDTAQLSERAETIDVGACLGALPTGRGVRGWIARAPGNELFHVELAEREIALPALPQRLDGLSILHLSDLHFNGTPGRPFFEYALERATQLEADLVALTGDVLDRHAMAEWLPTTLGRLAAPLGCYFILGNHDAYDEPEKIRAALCDLGWIDVGGRSVVRRFEGQAVLIAGDERPWIGTEPALPVGGRADGGAPTALRVLLAHSPERFAWARAHRFDLVLAGHLHGGQIDLPLIGPVSGGRYHAGVFSAGATVMHVSRGLGAMFPFRWNCPAEVTKLVLRTGSAA
jgi:predicted MPP superfamily phosphohydrolase